MMTWHIVSLVTILCELLLVLRSRQYHLGMIFVVISGMLLAALGMWIGGDESFASAPIIPCFIAFTILAVKEIRSNHSFATLHNPYCPNNKMPLKLRFILLGLAIVYAVVKLALLLIKY